MTFDAVARAFARRFNWGPERVAAMTPYQVSMYAPELGRAASPFDLLAMGPVGRRDPNLPGKRTMRVPLKEYVR